MRGPEKHTVNCPLTVSEGVKRIHRLLGICPALPLMAFACGFDCVWHMGHIPPSLLPPGSRDYSTQVRPLPSDLIGNTGEHDAEDITDLLLP